MSAHTFSNWMFAKKSSAGYAEAARPK